MAGMINNFQDNPRYQKYIQKIQALRPDQRAIIDTALIDEKFADEAMRKQVQSLTLAADLANKKRSLDLAQKRYELNKEALGLRTALKKDERDLSRKQERWGTGIELANIPISGYFGYKDLQDKLKEAEETKKFRTSMMSKYGVGV